MADIDISPDASTLRDRLEEILARASTRNFILAVILFNAILLGMDTNAWMMAQYGSVISALDQVCLAIFVIELSAKLYVQRGRFFRGGWNNFDFIIVVISLIPGSGSLSVLRALRILRLLRVISVSPSLRRVVEGLITALPGMGSVFVLMALIFYIGAVMSTKLFGDAFPIWFGSLSRSGFSLFQIMTLESWSMGIVRPVMEVYPYAWAFFLPFILFTTFAVVNLLVGLIVNSMQDAHSKEENQATDAYRDQVMERLDTIEKMLKDKGS